MKFLHCSDFHLGRRPSGGVGDYSQKRYEDYFKSFEYAITVAIDNKAKCFLVAGDLFDKKDISPDILERAEKLFRKLRDADIKPIVIEGNHDCILGSADDSWINYLNNKGLIERPYSYYSEGNLICKTVKIEDVEFYGLGYQGGYINESLLQISNILEEKSENKNVLLVHTALYNLDELLPGTTNQEIIEKLRGKVIYIAGGHFHKYHQYPNENPYFFVPGAPEHYDFGEIEYKKGFILFDTDNCDFKFIPSKQRNCLSLQWNFECVNTDDFYNEFKQQVDSLEINANEDIVNCNINLSNSLLIEISKCEDYLLNKGALKAFIKIGFPKEDENQDISRMLANVEQIETQIITKWEHYSEYAKETSTVLAKLKEYQESKNEELFKAEFDSLLNFIISRQKNAN